MPRTLKRLPNDLSVCVCDTCLKRWLPLKCQRGRYWYSANLKAHTGLHADQWWKVTKYIYLSTVLKYHFEVRICTVLEYFQFPILLLLLHYISEANTVLLLHYNYLKTFVTSFWLLLQNHFSPTMRRDATHFELVDRLFSLLSLDTLLRWSRTLNNEKN